MQISRLYKGEEGGEACAYEDHSVQMSGGGRFNFVFHDNNRLGVVRQSILKLSIPRSRRPQPIHQSAVTSHQSPGKAF
jgi:hypothetical protein